MSSIAIASSDLQQIFFFVTISFVVAILVAPLLTDFLYKNKVGKHLRLHDINGEKAPIFSELHKGKKGTPVMGGLLFWVTTAVFTLLFNLSREQTWLPLFALVAAALIGGVDDLMNAYGIGGNGGGLRLKYKFWIYAAIAAVGAWWFYFKLGWNYLYIPFNLVIGSWHIVSHGSYVVGLWFIPVFLILVIFSAFSVNQTDGLDGLAGGVCSIAFFVFIVISLAQGKIFLAVFCATMLGSLLGFLWFNINPARFFMGDTGSMALGMVLPILAFLTNSELLLPLILLIPFIEGITTVIQIFSKKVFHRKVFKIAPIHHHFEAIGWPETKVTMRFWLISAVGSSLALLLMLAS